MHFALTVSSSMPYLEEEMLLWTMAHHKVIPKLGTQTIYFSSFPKICPNRCFHVTQCETLWKDTRFCFRSWNFHCTRWVTNYGPLLPNMLSRKILQNQRTIVHNSTQHILDHEIRKMQVKSLYWKENSCSILIQSRFTCHWDSNSISQADTRIKFAF